MPKRKHVHVPVVGGGTAPSGVPICIRKFRETVESALAWPAGTCAKLREIVDRDAEREEIRKRRALEASHLVNLSDLCRLVGVPFPAPQGILCKPAVANPSQVDNQKDNTNPKTKRRG